MVNDSGQWSVVSPILMKLLTPCAFDTWIDRTGRKSGDDYGNPVGCIRWGWPCFFLPIVIAHRYEAPLFSAFRLITGSMSCWRATFETGTGQGLRACFDVDFQIVEVS